MDSRGLPFWFVIAFTTIVLAGSYWATCQILAKSSSAYRSIDASQRLEHGAKICFIGSRCNCWFSPQNLEPIYIGCYN